MLERDKFSLAQLELAAAGITCDAQQLVGYAGHGRDNHNGKGLFSIVKMVRDNGCYAPDTFTAANGCSSKFQNLYTAFHKIAPI